MTDSNTERKFLINKSVIKDHENPHGYHVLDGRVKWFNGDYQYSEPITPFRRYDSGELLYLVGVRMHPMRDQHLNHFQEIELT